MVREVADGIYRIDVNHPAAQATCCYLISADKDAAVLIDCGGGTRGEAAVLSGLQQLNIAADTVRLFLVTHAHLDHAGAAGLLMRHFSQALFAAHPSALKHLLAPQTALAPASQELYGNAFYNTYYGGLIAVPDQQSRALADNEVIELAGRRLQVLFTPGHAWHHASFYDEKASFIAAGDAYGISYRQLDVDAAATVVPVMPPSQYNPPAMQESLQRLYDMQAAYIGLTHFDVLDNARYGDDYFSQQQQAMEEWTVFAADLFARAPQEFYQQMTHYLVDWTAQRVEKRGGDGEMARRLHKHDAGLTALGMEYYLKKQAAATQA